MANDTRPIYSDLSSETDDPGITSIESLCFECQNMGTTNLLLTKIPHYKEVIVSSFLCDHCGNRNSRIQTGAVQDFGVRYELNVTNSKDLSRQIVRSENCEISIPVLEFEIPSDGDRGEITNLEGLITQAVDGLKSGQAQRYQLDYELARQIQEFIEKLEDLLEVNEEFTVILDDPSGNSYIENPHAPEADPKLQFRNYERTAAQNERLGLNPAGHAPQLVPVPEENEAEDSKPINLKDEVLSFNTLCDNCSRPAQTKMKVTDIPHFKESVLMCTQCDHCGHKTNEVKGGGGIEPKGRRIVLHIKQENSHLDMARDVLKSETCSVKIPQLSLDAGCGVIVGKFTTVEGLLKDMKEGMGKNPFLLGDSAEEDRKEKMEQLFGKIDKIIQGHLEADIVLDDPAGNSYLQDLYLPEKDPFLDVEDYERSFEQNEDLGINDMKTENYSEKS